MMGEAPPREKEYILCIMPFDKPTEIIAGLLRKHPNVEFKFFPQVFMAGQSWGMSLPNIPNGKHLILPLRTYSLLHTYSL